MSTATIIADASYCSDTKAGGYGYWIASDRGKLGGGGSLKDGVDGSGAAEMLAVCNALHIAVQKSLVMRGDQVLIQTDCVAAIQAFERRRKSSTTHEAEAVRFFHSLRIEASITVSFRHVKGHTNRAEARFVTNNLCDKRAKQGMRLARARIQGNRT